MGTLQLNFPLCLIFPADVGVPSSFGKCCAAKDLAQRWSQSRATSQVHCMWQKQMSKLSSVSSPLRQDLCYLSLALILQATCKQIIFIHSNISLTLVVSADAQKVCRDWSLYKQREEKTGQTQSKRDHVHLPLKSAAIYQHLQHKQTQRWRRVWTLCWLCHPYKQAEGLLFPDYYGMK